MTSFEPIAPGGAMLPRSGHLLGAHYADWLRSLQSQLDQRRADHLLRELHPSNVAPGSTICLDGREYLQFCSNNYLGLAADPRLIEAAREATSRFGTGSGAARLVAGSLEIHQRRWYRGQEWTIITIQRLKIDQSRWYRGQHQTTGTT